MYSDIYTHTQYITLSFKYMHDIFHIVLHTLSFIHTHIHRHHTITLAHTRYIVIHMFSYTQAYTYITQSSKHKMIYCYTRTQMHTCTQTSYTRIHLHCVHTHRYTSHNHSGTHNMIYCYTHSHTNTHTLLHTDTDIHHTIYQANTWYIVIYTCIQIHTHSHTQTCTHTSTVTQAHMYIVIYTCIHTHTFYIYNAHITQLI